MKHVKIYEDYEDDMMDDASRFGMVDYKDYLIEYINKKVEWAGGIVSIREELGAEYIPFGDSSAGDVFQIETLLIDSATVVGYGGYKNEYEVDEFSVKYEDLEEDTLIEIKDKIKHAIEDGILKEDQVQVKGPPWLSGT